MTLYDPVESFGEEIEDIRSRGQTKNKADGVIEGAIPLPAHEAPVGGTNRDVMERALQVKLRHEGSGSRGAQVSDCFVEAVVNDVDLLVGDAVVDGRRGWPRKMIDKTKLIRMLPFCTSERRCAEVRQRRFGKRSERGTVLDV